jgi:Na+-driven multidrug efflux pump
VGAALATAMSQVVGGIIPLIYFGRKNSSLLRLGKTNFDGKALLKTCTNGSSELMSNVSMSLVNMLYNIQLLALAGKNGVGLRHHDVCEYDLPCYLHRLFYRHISGGGFPPGC